MRRKIIGELAKCYEKDEQEIIDTLKEYVQITPYETMLSKGRTVINKFNIPTEEQIALDYYKFLLNKYCDIKFPNRSYIMTELMNLIPALHKYYTFTIYKFDFKEFFYNISPTKSFQYISDSVSLKTDEFMFLKNYTNEIEEFIPGVGLHNSFVELCGKYFDLEMKKAFQNGLLYYARYVDDCILILDEKIDKNKIESIILKIMKKCFGNKLEINVDKTECYHSSCIKYEFDYLGYVFQKGQEAKNPFKFGISPKKLEKYEKQIENIILEYKNNNDIEMLSFKLELVFKRVVYYGNRKNNKKYRWQVRGISDSYKELKRFMKNNEDYTMITKSTETFFCKIIERNFRRNRIDIPAKIKNQLENKKFISCFLNNRALLLHRKLGLNHSKLKAKTSIVYKNNLDNYSYSELANILLTSIR